MHLLSIQNLSKSFDGGNHFALNNISLQLKQGEICALVGQSGSGKTTLLRLIAGLETTNQGQIIVNSKTFLTPTTATPPHKRNIGFVFQDYALFPHLTVAKNIGFGITQKAAKTQRIATLLKLVNLENYGHRYPHELSGGEQQRVALARALAPKPTLLLLDEPFSNLDTNLKTQVRNDLFHIIKTTKVTCIFVTHDTQDAMIAAHKIAVLKKGHLEQVGTPQQLFKTPSTPYVASLFDTINILTAADLLLFGISLKNDITYGLRPSAIRYYLEEMPNCVKVQVVQQIFMGDYWLVDVKLGTGKLLILKVGGDTIIKKTEIYVCFERKDLIFFE